MLNIIGCGPAGEGWGAYLILDRLGVPVHVVGQLNDVYVHALDQGIDRIAFLTETGSKIVRIARNKKGWQERAEDPFLIEPGLDDGSVPAPPRPVLYYVPVPDLS